MVQIVVFDIETTTCSDPQVLHQIAADVKPPATMTKADTLAKWEQEKKPEAVMKALAATALDASLGTVSAFGWQTIAVSDATGVVTKRGKVRSFVRERDQGVGDFLHEAFQEVRVHDGERLLTPVVAGHNIVSFDLPYLWQQCVRFRVPHPLWLPVHPTPWERRVLDTMVVWAGTRGSISLDRLARTLGVERDESVLPSDAMPRAWEDGEHDEVRRHLDDDVRATAAIVERVVEAGWRI